MKRKNRKADTVILERSRIETLRDREEAGFRLFQLKRIHEVGTRLKRNEKKLSYIG